MLISSADLIGTAGTQANQAGSLLREVYDVQPLNMVASLTKAEELLVNALAEVRAARWGVTRRMPQFDNLDLDLLLANEVRVINEAHGYIPAAA